MIAVVSKICMHCEVGAIAFVVDYGFVSLALYRKYAQHLRRHSSIFTVNTQYNFQRRDAVIKRATKLVG